MSVRAYPGEKTIIIFETYKAIFCQNLSNALQWVGPN